MTPSRSSFVFLPIALFALAGCAVSTPSVGNLANPLTPTPSAPSTPSTPTPTPTTPSTPTTPTTAPSGTASILYSVSNSIADTNGTLVRAASVVGYSTNALGPIDPATNTFNSTNPAVTINFTDPALGIGGLATDAAGNIYVLAADIDQTYEEIPGTAKIMVFAPP